MYVKELRRNHSKIIYVSELKHDTPVKEVWQKVRAIKSSYIPQTYPFIENNTFITDPREKANCLVTWFAGVASLDRYEVPVDFVQTIEEAKNNNNFEDYNSDLTMLELEETLQRAKNTAAGKDQISNKMLKILPENIKNELLMIFNKCFTDGVCPSAWKKGLVVPILKPGKPEELVSSYRPISLIMYR